MPLFNPACAVKATEIADPTKVHEFKSLVAAKKAMMEWHQKNVGHSLLKKFAEKKHEAYGYRWELVNDDRPSEEDMPQNVFTFRECVENIFNGGKVRVTEENPRRASVFDVISIVSETTNPRAAFQRLCAEYEEVVAKTDFWQFPGARQRETPVANAENLLYIVNLLPGRRAALFRLHAMRLLVRFLAGDQSLVEDITANARAQDNLCEGHAMRMFTEEVYAHPRSSKYVLRSPAMAGKFLSDFYYKPVVYLLTFDYNDKQYIKVGWSDDIKDRMDRHFRELPGCNIYSIVSMDNAYRLEKAWKESFTAHNEEIEVNGKLKTELFIGITPETAEQRLQDLWNDMHIHNKEDKEIELTKMKYAHELALKDKEIELLKLQLQLQQLQNTKTL